MLWKCQTWLTNWASVIDHIELCRAQRGATSLIPINLDVVSRITADARLAELLLGIPGAQFTVDGAPLVPLLRLVGLKCERVSGSDIAEWVVGRAHDLGWRLFLLGATEERNRAAVERLRSRGVQVSGVSPTPEDLSEPCSILASIRHFGPDVVLVGLGFPKQEMWISQHRSEIDASVVIAVGGTIDFLSGAMTRAPEVMRKIGLEWVYRMVKEPTRLGPRYLTDAVSLPRVFASVWGARQ